MVRRFALAAALFAALVLPPAAVGQEATPADGPAALPVTPDPAECVVEPRTFAEIADLVGTPRAGGPGPGAGPAAPGPRPTTPPSRPADAETVTGIVATVRQFIACVNAGDELRGYALYTDDFVRSGVFVDASLEEPPVPEPPNERVTLLDVVYVREYPDGRVGAVVVIDDPLAPSPAEPFFFVFRKVGDRWLFDEWPTTTYLGSPDAETAPAGEPPGGVTPPTRQRPTPTPRP